MTPSLSRNHVVNDRLRYAVLGTEVGLLNTALSPTAAYLNDLLGGELGLRVCFTKFDGVGRTARFTSFVHHIAGIVGGGSEKEMGGVHTGAGVAAMAGLQPFRNWAKGQFVGEAVGTNRLPKYTKDAVPFRAKGALPKPARASLVNMAPKTGFKRGEGTRTATCTGTFDTAKAATPSTCVFGSESRTAMGAIVDLTRGYGMLGAHRSFSFGVVSQAASNGAGTFVCTDNYTIPPRQNRSRQMGEPIALYDKDGNELTLYGPSTVREALDAGATLDKPKAKPKAATDDKPAAKGK